MCILISMQIIRELTGWKTKWMNNIASALYKFSVKTCASKIILWVGSVDACVCLCEQVQAENVLSLNSFFWSEAACNTVNQKETLW